MFQTTIISENTPLPLKALVPYQVTLTLKREDLLHPSVSGNKYRKLKYNISEAKEKGYNTLLTFGGAFSNHIAATAYAGALAGIHTIAVIRGEELEGNYQSNTTLHAAEKNGMQFHFVTRAQYRMRDTQEFIQTLRDKFGSFYTIPEGGTNALAVQGCSEILTEEEKRFDYITAAVGTGGTLAGLVVGSGEHQQLRGYSVLNGTFQEKIVRQYTNKTNYIITDAHCLGGYAKIDTSLIRFMNEFKRETGILLDPIYTGKLMYGLLNDINNGKYPKNSSILAIHTGGLQGIPPMNKKLQKKNLPQIEI